MSCYGIGLLPLIRQMKAEFPEAKQKFYADDGANAAKFKIIRAYFVRLCELGPLFGYYPEPDKSILNAAKHNLKRAKAYFADLKFKIKTGSRYLGSFIGDPDERDLWIAEKVEAWQHSVQKLAGAAQSRPQAAYAGLQKSVQHEWQYLQCTTPEIGPLFEPLEQTIRETFLTALFGEPIPVDNHRCELSRLPVKHSGLALPNPVESAKQNYEASRNVCSHLIDALLGKEKFETSTHLATIAAARETIQETIEERHMTELHHTVSKLSDDTATLARSSAKARPATSSSRIVPENAKCARYFVSSLRARYVQASPWASTARPAR